MLSDKRKAFAERNWYHRKGGWNAPFQTILNDVMVAVFYDDDDYDEVKEYLTERFYYD